MVPIWRKEGHKVEKKGTRDAVIKEQRTTHLSSQNWTFGFDLEVLPEVTSEIHNRYPQK